MPLSFMNRKTLQFYLLLVAFWMPISGQSQNCVISGSLNGWVTQGLAQVVSSAGGNDYYGNFPLGSPGSGFAIRLGNSTTYPQPYSEATYTFMVSSSAPFLNYYYAMVNLDYPHNQTSAANSTIRVYDSNGNLIPCTTFEVFAAFGGPPGFLQSPQPPECNFGSECFYNISYLPWKNSIIDLRPYIGQNVTIQLNNSWCIYGVDWGYSYLDAQCVNLQIEEECQGQYVNLNAPPGGISYLWNTGATSQSIQPTAAGNYSCIITPAQGSSCNFTLNYNYVPSTVNATFNVLDTLLCNDKQISFGAVVSGTSNAVDYLWQFGDGSSSTLANPVYTYTTPGNYTVSLTVTNPISGCQAFASQMISVLNSPTPQITGDFDVCSGTPAVLNASGGNGSFLWNTGASSSSISVFSPGNYTVTVTDANGCSNSLVQQVVVYPNPPVPPITGLFQVCSGVSASLEAGAGFSTYAWSNGATSSSIYPYSAGSYTVTVSDANGCTNSNSQFVTVRPLPTAAFIADTVCEGINTSFKYVTSIASQPIANYNWDFGDGTSPSFSAQPTHLYPSAGNYSVTLKVETSFGCKDSINSNVLVHDNPIPLIQTVQSGCTPYTILIRDSSIPASAPLSSWDWDFGNGIFSTDQNPTVSFNAEGSYDIHLEITDRNGCKADSIFKDFVIVNLSPIADFYIDPASPSVFISSIHFFNTTTNAEEFYWDFGDGNFSQDENPDHAYDTTGQYLIQLAVKNIFGCTDTLTREIEILNDYAFWIPNAFSPNEDGVNEVFLPKGFNISNYFMTIYNRWGEVVFESNDLGKGWNGTMNEKASIEDVYVYKINFRDIFNTERTITGRVSLIR